MTQHLLTRKMTLGADVDMTARTVPVVLSTEAPVDRGRYVEVLSHRPGDVDLSRAPLPLIVGHDLARLPVGVVEGLHLDGPRLRGLARFGHSAEAEEALRDVQARVLRSVSVGYVLTDDGTPTTDGALRFRWQPIECSAVAVPADPGAGFFRAFSPSNSKGSPMPDIQVTDNNPQHQSRSQRRAATNTLQAERERVADLQSLGERFERYGGRELAAEFIRTGGAPDELGRALLERAGSSGRGIVAMGLPDSVVGMNARELASYSITRLIRCQIDPEFAARNRGLESEVSHTLSKRFGRDPRGIFVPTEVFRRDLVVGTAGLGGNLVPTEYLEGQFVDVLRNRSLAMKLGVTMLPGLVGNVTIPTKVAGATTYWVAEGTAPTEGSMTFGQIPMTPKSIAGYVDFSRKMILQASPAVEQLVRQDLADGAAAGVDAAAFVGAGTGSEPLGVLASTAVTTATVGTHGGAPDWTLLTELEAAIAAANADNGNLAYVTNAAVRKKLRRVQLGTGLPMIWGDTPLTDGMSSLAGYRAGVTNAIPGTYAKGTSTGLSAMVFGNWSDLVIGLWGGLDVLVDPFTGSKEGTTRVVVFQDVDVAIRRAASFAVCKELATT